MLQAVSATLVACHCRSCNAMGFAVVVGVCGAGAKDESQWAHGATGDNHEIYIYIYMYFCRPGNLKPWLQFNLQRVAAGFLLYAALR